MATYACSDLHGMYHLYECVKEFIKPEDKVIFLGDAGDRGPQSWKTITTILEDPQFIYLKGNHEHMLIEALNTYIGRGCDSYSHLSLLVMNGGFNTYNEAIDDENVKDIWYRLKNLPLIYEYINNKDQKIVLSHAGFTPWVDDEDKSKYIIPNDYDLVWDRDHLLDTWNDKEWADVYIVHGHTPIEYLLEEVDPANVLYDNYTSGALYYECGRKCCIDHGAVFTGKFILLNLDTMQETIFSTTPYI